MPSFAQLLTLPNLQRNLLFTTFLETPHFSQFLEGCAIVRNSLFIHNAITLFSTYIGFYNFYAEKLPSYDKFNWSLG